MLLHKIPIEQRDELIRAIMTLITVVIGIALTLTTQVVTGALTPDPVVLEPANAMQALGGGTTHFSNLSTTDLDADTGTITDLEATTFELDNVDFTGSVIAVSSTISHGYSIAHTLGAIPSYAVCSANDSTPVIVTITTLTDAVVTVGLKSHDNVDVNNIPVFCLLVP